MDRERQRVGSLETPARIHGANREAGMKRDRTELLMIVALIMCTAGCAIGTVWMIF